MSFFPSTYKPQIRQEGFHLPSPTSPTGPSPPSPPPSASAAQFDTSNNIFMPQNYLPDAFRKYPAGSADTTGSGSMDFTDELASLIAQSPGPTRQQHDHNHHQSSHERSTQSPNPGETPYDDEYRNQHNLFEISAPQQQQQQQQQQHHHQHSNPSGFPTHFSLPPTLHRPADTIPLSQPSSLHTSNPSLHQHHSQQIHDFSSTPHSHFNTTLPVINSNMRFEPHPQVPSQNSDVCPPSSFTYQSDYRAHNRHSPSPIGTSRSRSRSRAPSIGPTRTTNRTRRNNSVSSTSPPPPGRPQAIVIPGSHRHMNGTGNGVPVSPLSLHNLSSSTGGWFIPSQTQHSTNEYNLPTPESITNPFGSSFAAATAQQPQNLGISPSEVTSLSSLKGRQSSSSLKDEKSTAADPVSKQALLANEKRRRRRESHNAVERRRRDNINEKISELATLIPECMLDPSAPVSSPSTADDLFSPLSAISPECQTIPQAKRESPEDPSTPIEGGVVKANKGMILRKSVEYIRYLQQLVNAQATRNRELEQALSAYREDGNSDCERAGLGHLSQTGLRIGMNGIVGQHGRSGSSNGSATHQLHTPTSNDSPQSNGNGHIANGHHDEMGGLMLHEEVAGDGFGLGGMGFHMGFGKSFHGFELASMPEDAEMDDRPNTGMTMSGTSPSTGSGEGEEDTRALEEEEERGRRGRDGRVRDGGVKKFEEIEQNRIDSREPIKAMET